MTTVEFGGLQITFDSRLLSPRPWTQAQSRWAASLLPNLPPGDVLELCSGAGQIGLLAWPTRAGASSASTSTRRLPA